MAAKKTKKTAKKGAAKPARRSPAKHVPSRSAPATRASSSPAKARPSKVVKKSASKPAKARAAKAAGARRAESPKRRAARSPSERKSSKTKAPRGKTPDKAAGTPSVRRRDALGHLDPHYAADLLSLGGGRERADDDQAFLRKPRAADDLAESLGETFVNSATTGEPETEEGDPAPEEVGGPFVETSASTEFAEGTDESNPEDASREPFPTT